VIAQQNRPSPRRSGNVVDHHDKALAMGSENYDGLFLLRDPKIKDVLDSLK
jgi:hypothetical protein